MGQTLGQTPIAPRASLIGRFSAGLHFLRPQSQVRAGPGRLKLAFDPGSGIGFALRLQAFQEAEEHAAVVGAAPESLTELFFGGGIAGEQQGGAQRFADRVIPGGRLIIR